ncbi:BTAD domain-containing putative transcriptional regulator [Nonomuraea sp. NPDC050394]|uniref:AfsR/SARP family transcriptional regulator n=1 Tax=Nonomuraea sp. NPDC050394 TaxID=3364363 RepID=UPI00378A64AB
MILEFRVLGPLEVFAGSKVNIEGRRRQIVLVMLLLEPGRVVTTGRLVEALYGEEPPKTADAQVQICVSQLRGWFGKYTDAEVIVTHSAGYLIRVPEDCLDLTRFRRHVTRGREAARSQDLEGAVSEFRSGLALWRGEALEGINSRRVQAAATRHNEERFVALQECIDLELRLQRHHELLGELKELVAVHPLREELHMQLALALYRADRQVEALEVLRNVQYTLVEEHGLSPGEELRQLEQAILSQDPALAAEPVAEPAKIVPHQLPAGPSNFVGRDEVIADVRDHLVNSQQLHRAAVVMVTGPGGVGKTALAVHAAHKAREAFPDGQLYAHLRDADGHPVPAEQVLERLLRSLGVAPSVLPSGIVELGTMYRSVMANRRVLVVLDDAASARQILPLVPAEPRCALLVTSRRSVIGLHGAHHVDLDVFDEATSLELLSQVIGQGRVMTQHAAARRLAEACGHLPLGLGIVAAKLSMRQHWQIDQMVRRLADERRRLDELILGDASVRATISISCQELDPPAARLVLLLGALDEVDFGGWIAGPLLDMDPYAATDILETLVEERLVDLVVRDDQQVRYRLHDLTRTYVRELLAREIPAQEQEEALHRLLRCWLHLAGRAHRQAYGGDYTILHSATEPWTLPEELVESLIADPIEWFQIELTNLVSSVHQAARLGLHELCWDLAVTSVTLFETRSYRQAWRETHEVAWGAVRRAGDKRGEAVVRYSLSGLELVEQRLAEAQQNLEAARAWFEASGDVHGRGLVLRHLAFIERTKGQYTVAQEWYEQALEDLRSVGDPVGEAHVLRNIAQIHLESGRAEEAEPYLRESLAICVRTGSSRIEAQVRFRLGEALLTRGRLEAAEESFDAALHTATSMNDSIGEAFALLGIGRVRLAQGDLAGARPLLGDALMAACLGGSQQCEGQSLLALAELALARDEPEMATVRLERAEAIFTDSEAKVWRARVDELRSKF